MQEREPDHSNGWQRTAKEALRTAEAGPFAELLEVIADGDLFGVASPLDRAIATDVKGTSTLFLVNAITACLDDGILSEGEINALRHIVRLLRIEEGDCLAHHPSEVSAVLTRELERLLADEVVEPAEAVHKVQLQEVFGLSYDQFLNLTAPEIETVVERLARSLDEEGPSDAVRRFRARVAALDTVYDLNGLQDGSAPPSGYLYLLVNPAMPGMVKVGRTSRRPNERVAELTAATGVPLPFVLVFDIRVPDAHEAEHFVHQRLGEGGARLTESREFFTVEPSEAVAAMLEARSRQLRGFVGLTTITPRAARAGLDGLDRDVLAAARICADRERISANILQDRLGVGYGRAASLLDRLCDAGVLGPDEGTGERAVTITDAHLAELDRLDLS